VQPVDTLQLEAVARLDFVQLLSLLLQLTLEFILFQLHSTSLRSRPVDLAFQLHNSCLRGDHSVRAKGKYPRDKTNQAPSNEAHWRPAPHNKQSKGVRNCQEHIKLRQGILAKLVLIRCLLQAN
jgi:hypothetical protein